jgi:hypothetical protein
VKFYVVKAYQKWSNLPLPFKAKDQAGQDVTLKLTDPTADSIKPVGFIPVFGNRAAAEAFSKGLYDIVEVDSTPNIDAAFVEDPQG